MYYEYYMCPKCEDRFIEKEWDDAESRVGYEAGYCPECGSRFMKACEGEKRADGTIYRVSLNSSISQRNTLKNLERNLGEGFDAAGIIKRIEAGDEVIFEGDLFHTYRVMEELSGESYTVTPRFPLRRFYTKVHLCPICGGETVGRDEELPNGRVQQGWYCENCNEWGMYTTVSKEWLDETIYRLEFPSVGEVDCEAKEQVMYTVDRLSDKEMLGDKIIVRAKAEDVSSILQGLETVGIPYEAEPPFPHEIAAFREFKDALDEICALNPGLDKEAILKDLELEKMKKKWK